MGLYVVTGSASGIGLALTSALKDEGHTVIGVDLSEATITADLSTHQGVTTCFTEIKTLAKEGLDGFIPCAGVGGFMGLNHLVIDVNYLASTVLTQLCLPLLEKKNGRIVMIGSNSMAMPGLDEAFIHMLLAEDFEQAHELASKSGFEAYPSSKAALCRWMKRKAVLWIQQGVRMNAIAPGMTNTAMTNAQRALSPELDAALDHFAESSPMGFAATPKMIVEVILFLLSEQSSFMCGAVVYADGGHAAVFNPDSV